MASNTAMGTNRVTANSMAISKVMGNRVVTVATRATATKAMASNMDMVMSSKAMDMASNKVMAMAETRAMDNMVVIVATKVMVIKAVMVAIKAMEMGGMVATKAMAVSLIRDTANKVMASRRVMGSKETTVATRAMDSKEATVETKAMANKTMVATRAMNSLATARTKV